MRNFKILLFFVVCMLAVTCNQSTKTIWLDELDLTVADQVIKPMTSKTGITGNPIVIDHKEYERGIGVHPHSALYVKLSANAVSFSGRVGHDKIQEYHPASCKVQFTIIGDDKVLWKSNFIGFFDNGEDFEVSLKGIDVLQIWALGNNGNFKNDAFIGDGKIVYRKQKPYSFANTDTIFEILTPKISDSPRFNAAKVFGVRSGSPIWFQPSVSGVRPMIFSAQGLPSGIAIEKSTGLLTGIAGRGEYPVSIKAVNSAGISECHFKIIVGDNIALTPPMGWSSWNVWGASIDKGKVMQALNAFRKHRLGDYGWTYINIDDGWQGPRGGKYHAIQPNEKFPDIKTMIDSIHAAGYKFGIYSSPWKTTYAGAFAGGDKYMGSSSDNPDGTNDIHDIEFGVYPFHEADARQWAEWGVDYMKYDWWPNTVPHTKAMALAMKNSGRDMVFSISNAAPVALVDDWKKLTNLWRTTGDIQDSWPCVMALGNSNDQWADHAGPGHWNDPDMMVLGWTGIQEPIHATRLSANEQYSLVSMWALQSAPLILGCDLSKMDDFTLGLITNNEVIDVNQDELGIQAKCISKIDLKEVFAKKLSDGSYALGLFNKGLNPDTVTINFSEINIQGEATIRDVWRQKDVGVFSSKFSCNVPSHGVVLLKIISKL
jgi:alpha-galactosidase